MGKNKGRTLRQTLLLAAIGLFVLAAVGAAVIPVPAEPHQPLGPRPQTSRIDYDAVFKEAETRLEAQGMKLPSRERECGPVLFPGPDAKSSLCEGRREFARAASILVAVAAFALGAGTLVLTDRDETK